jgi:chromosome segregation ATPase
MTVKELSKLYWLNREVELNKRQLADLEKELEQDRERLAGLRRSLAGLASPKLDGMPHGSDVSSPVENTVEQIMMLEAALTRKHDALVNLTARISARQTLIILERDKLEQYINTVTDSNLRQMFTLRFVNGLPWEQVAAGIGEGYSVEAVRKAVYRHIKKN